MMPLFNHQKIATGDLHGDHAITGFNIDLPKDFEGPHQPINPHGLSAGSWGKFSGNPKFLPTHFRQGRISGTFTQSDGGLV